MRDKNILDEGIKCHETVVVNSLTGKITSVDFNTQEVWIEVKVPAHMVKRPVIGEPKPVFNKKYTPREAKHMHPLPANPENLKNSN